MTSKRATQLSFVCSTGEFGMAVRSDDGTEDYVSIPMRGRSTSHDFPVHDRGCVPEVATGLLRSLQEREWQFDQPGSFSQTWCQHDMGIYESVDGMIRQIGPALGWEFNAAVAQTARLNQQPGFPQAVGICEERFVCAKLLWAIDEDAGLAERLWRVMFTGDWVAGMLTGEWRMSESDALSNGLLRQDNKHLAALELQQAGFDPNWFNEVIPNDEFVGTVSLSTDPLWRDMTEILQGWQVTPFLGDNQATAAGCGAQLNSIVVSMGNSATVNRVCAAASELKGEALRFDYWNDRLLLLMSLGAVWYNDFVGEDWSNRQADLTALAESAELSRLVRTYGPDSDIPVPAEWETLDWGEQVASVKFSIALEVLLNTKRMLAEVDEPVTSFLLTGGMVRCRFLRHLLRTGLQVLCPDHEVRLSRREGPLAFKTDALGAVFCGMLAENSAGDLSAILASHCPTKACDSPEQSAIEEAMIDLWRQYLV